MAHERREDSLIRGLAAGDEGAFERLFDAFGARMQRAAVGLLGSRDDAEDCVQEVFLGVLRSRGRLGAVADLEAYLFASLRTPRSPAEFRYLLSSAIFAQYAASKAQPLGWLRSSSFTVLPA